MALFLRYEMSGSELYSWWLEDDVYYRKHVSLEEAKLMAENRSRGRPRCLRGVLGQLTLRMTEAQKGMLEKRFPGLKHGGRRERDKILDRIVADGEFRDLVVTRQ